jgi:hypothetical protein
LLIKGVNMKKNILAVILILYPFFFVNGQNADPVDLVLLLNTSSGMSSSYENVNNYITGPFLSEFLRVGDTFHLIVFSQSPRLDIARRINQRGDVETIIGRMMLQYPVENGNNLAAAITFTENYISSLPSRPKKIVLVTTGGQDVNNIVSAAKDSFKAKNATFDFVQVTSGQPLTNLPKSGQGAVTPVTTPVSGTGSVSGTISNQGTAATGASTQGTGSASGTASTQGTASAGVSQGTGSASGTISNQGTAATGASSQGTGSASGTASTQGTASAGTSGTSAGGVSETGVSSGSQEPAASGTAESGVIAGNNNNGKDEISESSSGKSSGNEKVSGSVKTSSSAGSGRSSSLGFIVLIILLILLVLGLIIFLASRRSSSSSSRPAAPVSKQAPKEEPKPFANHSKELANYAAVQPKQRTNPYSNNSLKSENNKQVTIDPSGTIIIKLFVEDQSLSIGKRNTHSLKSGYSLSVGGGNSDFLIFLVQVPPHIGEIHRNGSQLTFIPRKSKYFPDLGSSELRDCLNKTIRVVSDKNYEIRFRFELYEDPLLALNRVLHSIKVPG